MAVRRYAECQNAECRNAEYRYAEGRYAECLGAVILYECQKRNGKKSCKFQQLFRKIINFYEQKITTLLHEYYK
jgi:hypothetical protein